MEKSSRITALSLCMVAQMANVIRESHTVMEATAGDTATAEATTPINNLVPNIGESLTRGLK